jgi:hypothetical protein
MTDKKFILSDVIPKEVMETLPVGYLSIHGYKIQESQSSQVIDNKYINIHRYQSKKVDAFPFYKPISKI